MRYECSKCGTLVWNMELHDRWHRNAPEIQYICAACDAGRHEDCDGFATHLAPYNIVDKPCVCRHEEVA